MQRVILFHPERVTWKETITKSLFFLSFYGCSKFEAGAYFGEMRYEDTCLLTTIGTVGEKIMISHRSIWAGWL